MPKPKLLKINVTQRDIDEGSRCNPSECPVALAIGRELDEVVKVGLIFVTIGNYAFGDTAHLPLPRAALDFIHEFDFVESVKPFSFYLPMN